MVVKFEYLKKVINFEYLKMVVNFEYLKKIWTLKQMEGLTQPKLEYICLSYTISANLGLSRPICKMVKNQLDTTSTVLKNVN